MIPLTSACLCWTLLSVGLVVLASKEQKAESGQDVTLTCRAPEGKTIGKLKWTRADLGDEYVLLFRDGQFVLANQHQFFKDRVDLQDRQMKDGDVSLILKDVTTADDGEYQCRVFVGETRSWETIRTIPLSVAPPAAGSEGGSAGLIVGLSVAAVLLVAGVGGGFLFYKHKQSQDSY